MIYFINIIVVHFILFTFEGRGLGHIWQCSQLSTSLCSGITSVVPGVHIRYRGSVQGGLCARHVRYTFLSYLYSLFAFLMPLHLVFIKYK